MRILTSVVALLSLLLLGWMHSAPVRAQSLQTWDAVPAFDPMHLTGAYAGRRVCPMCTHGYDAGLVLFVPSDSTLADAAAALAPLYQIRAQIESARFRVFVIAVGAAPEHPLLKVLGHSHPQWHVAHLSGSELTAAEADFGFTLSESTSAFVYAQRRLLRRYTETALLDAQSSLAADARYAMELLDWLHPQALPADVGKDTPQGDLWLAPSRLQASVQLGASPAAPACFVADDGAALSLALLSVRSADDPPSRPHWERTDARGCLSLSASPGRYRVTLYPLGQARLERELVRIDADDMPPVLGRCDGCEAVYDGRPLHLSSHAQIAADNESGERLRVQGQVYGADGKLASGVQIYAYQTDHAGSYPPQDGVGATARRHGRLRGWAVSDQHGHYRFDTIRPASYPGSTVPQHIHMHVIEPGRCTYYLDDVLFSDDPHVAGKPERRAPRGGNGLTRPERGADGAWQVHRDVHLGRNVADYAGCSQRHPR